MSGFLGAVLVPLLVIVGLVVANGVFVAAEFAIVGARRARLEGRRGWAAENVRLVLSEPARADRYIAIAQVGITLATIGLGMVGEPAVARWIEGPLARWGALGEGLVHLVGTVLAVGIMTYLHVVVGEMIPKALALQAPEATALRVARPMRITGLAFRPLVALLDGSATLLMRALRIPVQGGSRLYSPDELVHLVEESREGGQVSADEQRLIERIFDFGELRARDVMTPRPRVATLPLDAGAERIDALIADERYSRYPVVEGDLDRVAGILHVKDFIRQRARGEPFDLRPLLRRAPRVPESLPAERLLEAFKRLRVHMAVVIDEHGATTGVATLEELLEAVVGRVEDEFDEPEAAELEPLGERRWRADGALPLRELEHALGRGLGAREAETVAGLALEALGRAPEEGDEVELRGGGSLRVEEVEGLAIRRVVVEDAAPPPPPAPPAS